MFVTIINDCLDDNSFARQATKVAVLFGCPVNTVGVKSDLEAAGNLIDTLDAGEGKEGVILVNVAPRHGQAKKHSNGTPFGYFYYKQTLVIASIDGLTLSLVKKLKLVNEIRLLDIPDVCKWLEENSYINKAAFEHIIHTQFRSLEFLPRVAFWLKNSLDLPYKRLPIGWISDAPTAIWWVDNFGNCKTTLLLKDLNFKEGEIVATEFGDFKCRLRLQDVPDGEAAIIIGSSGLKDSKFLEVVIQGKSAHEALKLNTVNIQLL